MCAPVAALVPIVSAAASVAGVAAGVMQGNKQEKAQRRAADQAQQNAEKQAVQADQEMNRRNMKQPNSAALASANQQAAQFGVGSTMLTGPQGVDMGSLVLGRQTLLGA